MSTPVPSSRRSLEPPVPQKVGELGFVPPAALPLPPRSPSLLSAPSPAISNFHNGLRRPDSTRQKDSALHYFLRPSLLALLGSAILAITITAFIHTQKRVSHPSVPSSSNPSGPGAGPEVKNHSPASNSPPVSTQNISLVYIGAIFIVAILVEVWLLIGCLRNLYYRLAMWIDQEYALPVPDPSDPSAPLPSAPPLPWWARAFGIKPQVVRPPLLPPYAAVLNIIRTGAPRSSNPPHATGDVEDGEVLRNLAIGCGHAAPAFDGEEFRKSTVLLAGPTRKSNACSSTILPNGSGVGLMRSLSHSLSMRFSHMGSSSVSCQSCDQPPSLQGCGPGMSEVLPSGDINQTPAALLPQAPPNTYSVLNPKAPIDLQN